MTNRVADIIRAAVVSGEYQPGQKLREMELSTSFGVSNSVIREAFNVLQGEGVVTSDPYRGRSVFSLGETEAKELVLMRCSLEALAAFLAAEKLSSVWGKKIRDVAEEIRFLKPASFLEWVRVELDFHRAVWGGAENKWLFQQLNQLAIPLLSVNTIKTYMHTFDIKDMLARNVTWEDTNSASGHQLVAKFILARDPQKARDAMIQHQMAASQFEERRKIYFSL
jgi:DNA-binding GntR family transcriptional regulator